MLKNNNQEAIIELRLMRLQESMPNARWQIHRIMWDGTKYRTIIYFFEAGGVSYEILSGDDIFVVVRNDASGEGKTLGREKEYIDNCLMYIKMDVENRIKELQHVLGG